MVRLVWGKLTPLLRAELAAADDAAIEAIGRGLGDFEFDLAVIEEDVVAGEHILR